MANDTILWRRLDAAGHDACRVLHRSGAWRLEGGAAFRHEGSDACLTYAIGCDAQWRTREGSVRGWLGGREVDFRITRKPEGTWILNDEVVPNLDACVDLDFGFTPATNLSQLRRVALGVGQSADVPVAWLDVAVGTLDLLEQRYERRAELEYWYEAPRFGYSALLEINPVGFVVKYPTLWEVEAT